MGRKSFPASGADLSAHSAPGENRFFAAERVNVVKNANSYADFQKASQVRSRKLGPIGKHLPNLQVTPLRMSSVKPETTSSLIEALTPIWQRILQLPSVGPSDDFFDLGGDSSLALQLFTEIAELCNRELLPVTIYQARTIAALAAFLEQPITPKFPKLVSLKEGTTKPPVFIAHGLGGTVMDFYQIVRHITTDHPIYGMQAKAINGIDEPLDRIEDMAEFHLAAIKEMQPDGPYILVGYSLGGLVALEMAQRLTANGRRVRLLAMIDAYPHMRFLSFGQRVRLVARQAKRGLTMFGNFGSSTLYQPPVGVSITPGMSRVREAAYLALTRYRPRFYPGTIKFVRAAVTSGFPADPAAVWEPLAEKVEIETVPGDHLGMIATHHDSLALVLSRYFSGAFC